MENRSAISMMSQSCESFPNFANDWITMETLITLLAPLAGATREIENRRCSIASYIPICKTVISYYGRPSPPHILDFKLFKKAICDALTARLLGWENKRLLFISQNLNE